MQKLKELLTSRKFWAALIGLALVIVKAYAPNFPLTEDQLTNVIYLIVAFIVGTGLESVVKAPAPTPTPLARRFAGEGASAGEGEGARE